MANIPVVDAGEVRKGQDNPTLGAGFGQEAGSAIERFGQIVGQTSDVFKGFQEKHQRLAANSAIDDLELKKIDIPLMVLPAYVLGRIVR